MQRSMQTYVVIACKRTFLTSKSAHAGTPVDACRINRGIMCPKSNLPKKPVDLWAYEASPFCKLARKVIREP